MPMERSERIGMMVSGGAHAGAILWLLIGGVFFSHDMPPPVATAEVSLMSQSEFDAMVAAAPKATTEAPPQPSLPEPAATEPTPPSAEPAPEPAPQPEPEPQHEPGRHRTDAARGGG
jgi:outer membrane biosynthesis protein TonB